MTYDTVDTPYGPLLLVAGEAGTLVEPDAP